MNRFTRILLVACIMMLAVVMMALPSFAQEANTAASGEITYGYVSSGYINGVPAIYGEATGVVGTESFIVKLYCGETLVGTATLVDNDKVLLNGASQTITWHAALTDDGDSWWKPEWTEGFLKADAIPDKAVLYVDGTEVSTCEIQKNIDNLEKPIVCAITDANGVIKSLVAAEGYRNGTGANAPQYAAALNEAFANANAGETVTIFAGEYTNNISVDKAITVVGETGENGNNLVNITGKLSITADGATVKNLNVTNASGNAGYIDAKDVLIEGCKIVGANGFRSCYTGGTVNFKNSIITGDTYGIHFDGEAGGEIVIDNCVITGWTSFASTITSVAISNTEFAEGNYNQLRFYQNVTMTKCQFNPEMTIDFGKDEVEAEFTECTVTDGSPLTEVIYLPDIAQMGIDVTVDAEPVVVVAMIGDICYLSIDEAFEAVQNGETITLYADAALTKLVELKDTAITIVGNYTLTINDADDKNLLKVYGKTTLNISSTVSGEVWLGDGAVLTNSTINGNVFVAGNVTFSGANSVNMLYDFGELSVNYGTEAAMKWTVEKGASLKIVEKARYGLGYGDSVTIYGNIEDALKARESLTDGDVAFFVHGLVAQENSGWNKNNSFKVEDAYVVIGSNNSFGNKSGNYGGNYTFVFNNAVVDASRITFYEATSKTELSFTNCDVVTGTFMTRDKDSKFTLLNTKLVSTTTSNGTDEGNYHEGTLILVNSNLTYSADVTVNGTIELDLNSVLTAPSILGTGKIVVDATNLTSASVLVISGDMSGFTGTVEVKGDAIYAITEEGLVIRKAVAEVNGVQYATLQEAVDAAKDGDVITIIADIADEAVTVNKSVTITSDAENKAILNNVSITIDGTDVALTVSNLKFTGTSYINANNGKALTVTGVEANVTLNRADAVTNSSAAFISLGAAELNNVPLLLTVTGNTIVVTGDNYPDPILGWRYIADGSEISGNTFGSEEAPNWDAVKLMNVMDGATITLSGNTVYVNGKGFAFGQNNSRDNAYTVVVDGNTFNGNADYVWVEIISGSTVTNATVQASSDNKVVANGEERDFNISDIKSGVTTWTSYAGIDVELDENGKVVGGTLASFSNVEECVAFGYDAVANDDGSYGLQVHIFTLSDVFTFKGYSTKINGTGISAGFTVDYEALEAYEKQTGKKVSFGSIFTAEKITNPAIINDLTGYKTANVNLIINGIDTNNEKHMGANFIMALYVDVDGARSYVSDGGVGDATTITTITYEQAQAREVASTKDDEEE